VLAIAGKGCKVRQVVIQQPCAELLKCYIERAIPDHASAKGQARHVFSSQTNEQTSI